MMRAKPRSVDIAVIGAGPAGASAAISAARAGCSVLLVERVRAADVGGKICGNTIAAKGLDPASEYVDPPAGPEVTARLKTGTLYAHGCGAGVRLPAPTLVLNRLVFGQRLLSDALTEGARLMDSAACVGWSNRDENRVLIRRADGEECEIEARVVIDASGYGAALTRNGGPTHADEVSRSQVGVGYREILTLAEPLNAESDGLTVFFPPGAERGYAWVFPMGGRLANVGIGTALDGVSGNLREAYASFVASRPELAGAEVVSSGGGMLPLRRPLASIVGDGFMAAGDAGCLTNPAHGGGIAPAVVSGVMAGEQASRALSDGDTSAGALWGYGVRVMNDIGKHYAAQELLKDVVLSLTSEDLLFLAGRLAESSPIIETMERGRLVASLGHGLRLLIPLAKKPGLARRIFSTSRRMVAIREHYENYPDSPAGLDSWLGRAAYLRRMGGSG